MNPYGRPRLYHPDRAATTTERQRTFAAKRKRDLALLHQQLTSVEAKLKQKIYHESQRHDWATPWAVFSEYDREFHFTLDVCATADTAKCDRYFSPEMDGLAQDWGDAICWMNPPYGRQIGLWLEKAYRSSLAGATVVCLVPARTGTRWWHGWVLGKGEIRYRPGRITFVGATDPAGFDSVAVIYRPPHPDIQP